VIRFQAVMLYNVSLNFLNYFIINSIIFFSEPLYSYNIILINQIIKILTDLPSPPIQNEPINPCIPSPCGLYSYCKDSNGYPSCSCQENYIGSPPNCRPECTINEECPKNKACMKQKCQDPCPGSCGVNANCNVYNHNPICSCIDGYTGDPFTSCYVKPIPRKYFFHYRLFIL